VYVRTLPVALLLSHELVEVAPEMHKGQEGEERATHTQQKNERCSPAPFGCPGHNKTSNNESCTTAAVAVVFSTSTHEGEHQTLVSCEVNDAYSRGPG
jgi:hypothetical protein